MPVAEVDVGVDLVRALVDAQFPALASLPLELAANGWDNVLFRLGADLAVRLPRREMAAELVEHEQRWLPELAPRLPLPIPAPVHCGRPALGYPWRWSVVPWFAGDNAEHAPDVDFAAAAVAISGFLDALHQTAPAEAPTNPYRGGPLRGRDRPTTERIAQLHDVIDGDAALAVWTELRDVPGWDERRTWIHGDLHPANIVVSDGKVSAVIDFGDAAGGDPATDLLVAWTWFPTATRQRFLARYDGATQARGRGWAIEWSLACLANSADNELIATIARRTLTAALED
ncbi:MAG: aminoglycoside phosphotransferase family protein [Actinobacteria bacterium]|nr:aminoglycoside phosphotransferase family protein [Actinomycetota bacterium]